VILFVGVLPIICSTTQHQDDAIGRSRVLFAVTPCVA